MLQIWLEPTEQMDIVDKHLSATLPEQFAARLASGLGLVYTAAHPTFKWPCQTKAPTNDDEKATSKWCATGSKASTKTR
jgi:hypothetical protein